jgi:hypothetical protein
MSMTTHFLDCIPQIPTRGVLWKETVFKQSSGVSMVVPAGSTVELDSTFGIRHDNFPDFRMISRSWVCVRPIPSLGFDWKVVDSINVSV